MWHTINARGMKKVGVNLNNISYIELSDEYTVKVILKDGHVLLINSTEKEYEALIKQLKLYSKGIIEEPQPRMTMSELFEAIQDKENRKENRHEPT